MARYYLQGYYWRNTAQNAFFAVGVLTCIALLACIFLGARARWVHDGGKATWRKGVYILSTVTILLYVLITVVDVGLAEALRIPSIDGHYYILYIFDSMFSQISEFSILAVMVWTVHIMLFGDFQSYGASGAIRDLTTLGFVIVGMLSTISWVLHTAILGSFIRNIPFSPTRVNSQTGIEVAYVAAFAISSILLFIMAGFVVARERSTASVLMSFAALLLSMRAVFILAKIIVIAYSRSPSYIAITNLNWAASFINFFAIIGVYVCVGIVGNMPPNSSSKERIAAFPGSYTYELHYKKPRVTSEMSSI